MSETKKGIISGLNEKGFGFIKPTEGTEKKDIFFHLSGLVDIKFEQLELGMKVCYVVNQTKKGLNAVDIVIDYFEYSNKETFNKFTESNPPLKIK